MTELGTWQVGRTDVTDAGRKACQNRETGMIL